MCELACSVRVSLTPLRSLAGLACCKNTFLLDADQVILLVLSVSLQRHLGGCLDEPSADTTQEIPTAVDTVYFKWRFYFQGISEMFHRRPPNQSLCTHRLRRGGALPDYSLGVAGAHHPHPHRNLTLVPGFQLGHIEYDVPQAAPGTPPEV